MGLSARTAMMFLSIILSNVSVAYDITGNSSAISYSRDFQEALSLPDEGVEDLPYGVYAIRVYTAQYPRSDSEYKVIQIYLSDEIGYHLPYGQGSTTEFETSYQGFLGFRENMQVQLNTFASEMLKNDTKDDVSLTFQIIVNGLDVNDTSPIQRYSTDFMPGIRILEFSTISAKIRNIFFYIGEEEPGPEVVYKFFMSLKGDNDPYDPELYLKFPVPEKLIKLIGH